MAKFMILYNAAEPAKDFMAASSPEEMKAGMDSWITWKDNLPEAIKFDFGSPIQAVSRISSTGFGDSDCKASGYSTMEANSKDIVVDALKTHPHLQRPDASIDVLEMLPMPGM